MSAATEFNPMTLPDLSRIRPGYETVINELRSRMSDDQIVDVLDRYRHGGMDRDDAMTALDIDFLGVLYELVSVYRIPEPAVDPIEEARQAEMLRLLLNDEEVPAELRQPASWRIRH
ncbi:hypothetical protein ELI15_13980 [Rhizobium ruizarguesonis]|uniref:hypothetical protein n=1 Tax=Rhizobium ruizarguesonis TaxID=2081791 RepID=UPI00103053EB|nr:hypothetical protein [Rhizobium ruizarguesonis]TAW65398.1 hypothetical protein ELI15_13980 [Rhizobium ruizarguesonis]